jgi:hypothetical protein
MRQVREDAGFQRELRASLDGNAAQWGAQLRVAEAEVEAAVQTRSEWVPKLEAKVTLHLLNLISYSSWLLPNKSTFAEV